MSRERGRHNPRPPSERGAALAAGGRQAEEQAAVQDTVRFQHR